jgi:structural maintenance of chromosomes protein 5
MSAKHAMKLHSNGSRSWNAADCFAAGYQKGSVLRIGMLNFLTYDEGEVFPGPKLNVVLGPNGTGKSTITHALCLACAGSPSTLGRSNDLTQFVKHGKEGMESYCEVDILADKGDTKGVHCVRRTINSQTKSSVYSLNSKVTTEKAIKELMNSLHIDVDNLTCFMAQDKVGKFTTTTPKGIMEMTLQSIMSGEDSSKTLYDVQQSLNDIEDSKRRKGQELRAKQDAYDNCIVLINSMQPEVDRMKRQDANKELLEKYIIHHTVIKAKTYKERTQAMQVLLNEAEAALQTANDKIAPLEQNERELRKQVDKVDKSSIRARENVKQAQQIIHSNQRKIEATDIQINVTSTNLEDIDHQREQHQISLQNHEKKRKQIQNDYDRYLKTVPDIRVSLSETKQNIIDLNNSKEILENSTGDADNRIAELRNREKFLNRELLTMKDPWQIYKQTLERNNNNGYWSNEIKAMNYLENNKEKFDKDVIGPLGMYINVKDPDLASIINSELQSNVNAFIVQTNDDEKHLRRIGEKVKIFTIKNIEIEPLRSPYSPQVLQSCEEFGFQGFLREFIECNELVMTYLCKFHRNMLMTLYAKSNSKSKFTDRHASLLCPGGGINQYKLILRAGKPNESGPKSNAEFYQYSASISRYNSSQGKTLSTKSLYIYDPRKISFLSLSSTSGNDGNTERSEIENELIENKLLRKKHENDVNKVQNDIKIIQKDIDLLSGKMRIYREGIKAPDNELNKLKKIDNIIESLKLELNKDTKAKRKKLLDDYNKYSHEILDYTVVICLRSEDCIKLHSEVLLENEANSLLKSSLDDSVIQLSNARENINEYKNNKNIAKQNLDTATRDLDEIMNKLTDLKNSLYPNTPEGRQEFVKVYNNIKLQLHEDTLEAIEVAMNDLEHAINSAVDNPRVIQRYEEKLLEKEELQEALQALNEEYHKHEEGVRAQSKSWLDQVDNIVNKIHIQFEEFMNALRYKGAVQVLKKGAIAEYEMQLSVSFKDESNLAVLSGQKHSGGERAVATIMYLMALQEVSKAPFRTVDEINQGMDEINERLVFDRIVQQCTNSSNGNFRPQYFLISPKLLQGLRSMDHEDVTVLMVWNGPGVGKVKWQLGDMLNTIRSKHHGLEDIPSNKNNKRKKSENTEETLSEEEDDDDSHEPRSTSKHTTSMKRSRKAA